MVGGDGSLIADVSHVAQVGASRTVRHAAGPRLPWHSLSVAQRLRCHLPPVCYADRTVVLPLVCLQLLSVAYAKHELTGDTVDVSLAWLEAGGRSSVEQLQEAAGA